ncbi:FAD-dependent oxidoreductase [Paenibacillus thalictri]|uniref:FAD-dependent oxidoreductase n=1 Tax=Paenibacillus thalictri TaxID=2527873 RepID=A0A4Q9DG49_9BACL|nr:FAD-dependent oxidoreductase [Paenibacillus thalictri]TBL71082.1 FAD-dependent oxidoreductase [Paenibacillus thalictri]
MSSDLHVEVAVIGGGPAGVAAAIAAARAGAKTVLVEPNSFLGGAGTASMVGPWMTNYYKDTQVIRGVFQDVVDELVHYEGSTGTLKCPYDNPGETKGTGGHITPFDAEILKFVLNKLVLESGCILKLNTYVDEVEAAGGKVTSVALRSKSSRSRLTANMFIDCTGDGDIAVAAGAKYEMGRKSDGLTQPVSALFKMSYIDMDAFIEYTQTHKDEFIWVSYPILPAGLPSYFSDRMVCLSGFNRLISQGQQSGELYLGRERITLFSDYRKGDMLFNATRLNKIDATSNEDLIRAEIDLREQIISLVSFARKYLPGFSQASLSGAASRVGVRETRRIMGDYVLDQEDVLRGRKFDDGIAKGCFPVDIHSPHDKTNVWVELDDAYDIPYRSLLPEGLENVLLAGRNISATHEAMASSRVQSHCMAMGQAAGLAAAMASQEKVSTREISVSSLQKNLREQNAIVAGDV